MSPSQSSSRANLLSISLFGLVLLPFLFLAFLYLSNWDIRIGQTLGVNLPSHPNLVIYSATCENGKNPIITLVYWTSQSAPLSLKIEAIVSPTINSYAGINTLEITLTRSNSCPPRLILSDLSRNRHTGAVVEQIQ